MDAREHKIMEAAMQLFGRHGFKRTTISDIAKAAGIGKGTVYLHFQSKEEVFLAFMRRESEASLKAMRAAVRAEKTASAQVRAYFKTVLAITGDMASRYGSNLETKAEIMANPEFIAPIQEFEQKMLVVLQGILEYGIEQGEFHVNDAAEMSLALLKTARVLDENWHLHGRALPGEAKMTILHSLVTNGLRNSAHATPT